MSVHFSAVTERDEHVIFLETALIEEELDALAGGELSAGTVRVDAGLPAAEAGLGAAGIELGVNGR